MTRKLVFIGVLLFLVDLPLAKGIPSQKQMPPYQDVIELIEEKAFEKAFDTLKAKKNVDEKSADHLALKSFLYTQIGERKLKETERREHFEKGKELAEEAIAKEEDHAFAHFAKALALGRSIQRASPSEKLRQAKVIKKEAEKAIQEDPDLAGAHHILGRWHLKIASLSRVERWSARFFLGELPEASFQQALQRFKKAARIKAREALHYYQIGVTYDKMGKPEKALDVIEKALRIAEEEGDEEILKKCHQYLGIEKEP